MRPDGATLGAPLLRSPVPMRKSDWLVSALLVLICGGILVLFTDVELRLVRWVNCSVLAPGSERDSAMCR